MNTFLSLFVLLAVVWFLALLGKERARREALRLRLEILEGMMAKADRNDDNLGRAVDALARAQNEVVTPEAFDTLHKAHLDLVERFTAIARKTAQLPG